jgi:hypothetical protein
MKTGLDYQKLMEFFVAQATEGEKHDLIEARPSDNQELGTFIERITVKVNGEVQISSWESLPGAVRSCERYTYLPDEQDRKSLEKTYGPIQLGSSKTIKKVLHDGKWVRV